MKAFYSILTILLSIFFIIYFLLFLQPDISRKYSSPEKASAKEVISGEHSSLSDSCTLSRNQTYQKKLSPHSSFFASGSSHTKFVIQITSKAISKLNITILSDTGESLSYNTHSTQNTSVFSLSDNTEKDSQRIFIKILNQDTLSHSFQIKLLTNTDNTKQIIKKPNHITSNPKKQTTSERDTNIRQKKQSMKQASTNTSKNQNTSNPDHSIHKKKQLSTIHKQKVTLYPQFIQATPGSVHNLTITSEKQTFDFSDVILLNSNPSVATIKDNKIYALKAGIAILYVRYKKNSEATSSCFIRVVESDNY